MTSPKQITYPWISIPMVLVQSLGVRLLEARKIHLKQQRIQAQVLSSGFFAYRSD